MRVAISRLVLSLGKQNAKNAKLPRRSADSEESLHPSRPRARRSVRAEGNHQVRQNLAPRVEDRIDRAIQSDGDSTLPPIETSRDGDEVHSPGEDVAVVAYSYWARASRARWGIFGGC